MITIKALAAIMLSFEPLSNKKLQKLCYYAYAWYLTLYHQRLAPLTFEAWVHGPVSRELYNYYRKYGWDDIPMYSGFIIADDEVIAFCRKVWQYYGRYSADELESMTHEEMPWQKAREGYKLYEPSTEIVKDADMVEYYRKNIPYIGNLFL